MTFGEVAALYDAVRPEHPIEIAGLVLAYAGSTPRAAAEIGAGTGKATALFAGRGFPITCVEPDPRMAGRIRERLPDADLTIVESSFEDWQPPVPGVDLLYAALAWHWFRPDTRASLAYDALAPGGTLALIGRTSSITDETLRASVRAVFDSFPGAAPQRPPLPEYAVPELLPLFDGVRSWTTTESTVYDADQFMALQQTMGPYRSRAPEIRDATDIGLRTAIANAGGTVGVRLDTHVVLARRSPNA